MFISVDVYVNLGVIEFHEAFAGQVLANMTAMGSEKVYIYM
jgi:acetyl-CoA acetyltransferase